jgi:hypothetical protein
MGGPGCPDATMPVPGLCRPGRRRPSPVCSSCPPGVLRGEPQRSSTPHPLTPCGGDARATLSDGPAGSEARMRPHRPQPAPEVFPMQSVATAPRGDRSQAAPCVPTRGALRPCRASSCSVCFATSPVRMVEHPTGPFASGFQRPSLRGVVRAQARTEARAWRVTRRRLETRRAMPCRARCRTWRPTLGETPSQRPRGRRSGSFTPFPRRLSPNGPTHPGCPGRVRKGRARLYRLQPLRRAPPRSPKRERTVGGEGGQRGSCCRVPVDVLGRGSRERPSPGRLACVAGRSRRRIPRWAGAGGPKTDRDANASLRAPERPWSSAHLAMQRRPSGLTSRGVSPSCVLS